MGEEKLCKGYCISCSMNAHHQKFFIVYCLGELMTGAGMADVTYYASNKDDPYITLENPVSKVKPIVVGQFLPQHFPLDKKLTSINKFLWVTYRGGPGLGCSNIG